MDNPSGPKIGAKYAYCILCQGRPVGHLDHTGHRCSEEVFNYFRTEGRIDSSKIFESNKNYYICCRHLTIGHEQKIRSGLLLQSLLPVSMVGYKRQEVSEENYNRNRRTERRSSERSQMISVNEEMIEEVEKEEEHAPVKVQRVRRIDNTKCVLCGFEGDHSEAHCKFIVGIKSEAVKEANVLMVSLSKAQEELKGLRETVLEITEKKNSLRKEIRDQQERFSVTELELLQMKEKEETLSLADMKLRASAVRLFSWDSIDLRNGWKSMLGFEKEFIQEHFLNTYKNELEGKKGRDFVIPAKDRIVLFLAFCRGVFSVKQMAADLEFSSGKNLSFNSFAKAVKRGITHVSVVLSSMCRRRITFPDREKLKREFNAVKNFSPDSVLLKNYDAGVIVVGSGTEIFKPTDPTLRKNSYCFYKGFHRFGWMVCVSGIGRPLFVSEVYQGLMDDRNALESISTGFNAALVAAYGFDATHGSIAICGDKGFPFYQPPGAPSGLSRDQMTKGLAKGLNRKDLLYHVLCTDSAKETLKEGGDDDEKEGEDGNEDGKDEELVFVAGAGESYSEKRPWLGLSPKLSPGRTVVERSIGYCKAIFPILQGPVYLSYGNLISDILGIGFGIISKLMDDNPQLLVRNIAAGGQVVIVDEEVGNEESDSE